MHLKTPDPFDAGGVEVVARGPEEWTDDAAYDGLRRFETVDEVTAFLRAHDFDMQIVVEEGDIEGRRWFSAAPVKPEGVQVEIFYGDGGVTRYASHDNHVTAALFARMAEALRGTNVLV
jgi:hypothetical protein